MKLKQCTKRLVYHHDKLTHYELLRHYNYYFISEKIKRFEQTIDELYSLNTSHTVNDNVLGIISVCVPTDKLAIEIIEVKERLKSYRDKYENNVQILNDLITSYSIQERKEIDKYFMTDGEYNPIIIIRLRKDLYKIVNHKRNQRNKARERQHKKIISEHIKLIKENLHSDREVLVV
ncbi:pathogenicity island protein [Macrococcoides bohemicum]|uniref:pathogenicity island protein n=1 Tax=Macrococcoides bohemicum TaxID=1903056 RepID=UPI001059894A|nr:pathogenicity island protein [Macrococcus bohemicus]TDL37709.1 pathogenicity island protein [Macrococcus bohemicus]